MKGSKSIICIGVNLIILSVANMIVLLHINYNLRLMSPPVNIAFSANIPVVLYLLGILALGINGCFLMKTSNQSKDSLE